MASRNARRAAYDGASAGVLKPDIVLFGEPLPPAVAVDRLSKLCKERTVFSLAVMLLVATRVPAYAALVRALLAARRADGARRHRGDGPTAGVAATTAASADTGTSVVVVRSALEGVGLLVDPELTSV